MTWRRPHDGKLDSVRDRVLWFLDVHYGGNRKKFAEAIGVSAALVYKMTSCGQWPGRKMLTAMCLKLMVDANWLLVGRGPVFLDD
jgi:hypothetical protein